MCCFVVAAVIFGRVLDGMSVVQAVEATSTNSRDRPTVDVTITNCGVLADS